jgi:hypothetical protein
MMSKFLICLALPAVVIAGVMYHRANHCNRPAVSASATVDADDFEDGSNCCATGSTGDCRSCAVARSGDAEETADDPPATAPAKPADPDREVVFKAEGLTCPAVKGIGCGHMLFPVLGRLDKLEGVAGSAANYTGTLVRVTVAPGADRVKVEEVARKALAEDAGEAVPLTGKEASQALEHEHWRGANRVAELSSIEFHSVALYRLRTFAKAEKLDQATTDKLTARAERQWEQIAKEGAAAKANTPTDWGRRCKQGIGAFVEQSKDLLSPEQMTRLKEALATRCHGDDRPVAPAESEKTGTDR